MKEKDRSRGDKATVQNTGHDEPVKNAMGEGFFHRIAFSAPQDVEESATTRRKQVE
jgi:hypothetical protein